MSKYKQGQILTGEEARKFMEQNPDYGYDVIDQTGNVADTYQGQSKSYGILDDIGSALVSPFANLSAGVAEQSRQGLRQNLGMDQAGAEYNPEYMSKDEWNEYEENPLGKNLQDIAGVGAFFVPGGAGVAGMAKAGLAAGAMSGFSEADLREEGDVLSSIAQGAATGGLMAGGIGALGKGISKVADRASAGGITNAANTAASLGDEAAAMAGKMNVADDIGKAATSGGTKAGSYLREIGEGRNLNAFRRDVGGVAPKRIGNNNLGAAFEKKVFDTAKDMGKQLTSVEDLAGFSKELFDEYGGIIQGKADELAAAGTKVEGVIDEVTSAMDKIKSNTVQSQQNGVQTALDDVMDIVSRYGDDPAGIYKAKQTIGAMGKWARDGQITPAAKQAYEEAYKVMSNKLEDTFLKSGFTQYREVNDKLQTALKSAMWADNNMTKVRPGAALNDPAQDVGLAAGMLTGGNPVAAAGGMAAGKFLQSTKFEKALGRTFTKAADVADFIGGKAPFRVPKNVKVNTGRLNKAVSSLADTQAFQKAREVADNLANNSTAMNAGVVAAIGAQNSTNGESELQTPEQTVSNMVATRQQNVQQAIEQGADPAAAANQAAVQMAPSDDAIYSAEALAQDPNMLQMALSDPVSATIVLQMAGYDSKESAQMMQMMGLVPSEERESGATDEKSSLRSSVSEMERLYGLGTENSLSQGGVTVGLQGVLGRVGRDVQKTTDQGFNDRLTAYSQMSSLAMGIINQARGAGTLNEGEAQVMMKNMPNEYTSEGAASEWFQNVRRMLG